VPIPISATTTIGGLTRNIGYSRTATLAKPGNPFSLLSQADHATINGRTYTSVFNAGDKTVTSTTPEGRSRTVVLDALERVVGTQTPGLLPVAFSYDARGRLASAAQGSRKTSMSYDSDGRVANVTDPVGRKWSFTYDAAGHLLTSTLPDGSVVRYAYDGNGNLVALTPPGGSVHRFAYTSVNLHLAYIPPAVRGTGGTTYRYDADREPLATTRPDGTTVKAGYDRAGRLNGLTTSTTTINYAYSPKTGNLTGASVSGGEALTHGYLGSLPTTSSWAGPVAGDVADTYDSNFWITSETVNNANPIGLAHDNDGLLVKAGSLVLARDPENGLIAGTTLGATTDTRTRNAFGELTGYSAKYGTTPLYTATYVRDGIGRISAKTETIGGQTATYDAQDRLLTYGTTSYRYTPNGQIASRTTAAGTTDFIYDGFGELVAVKLPNGTVIEYIIDAEGRRVGKRVNGGRVAAYLYSGSRIVAQLNLAGQVISRFIYATGATSPDYMVAGGVTYRLFTDQLGSPRLVVNTATGQVAEEIDYDEFGNILRDTKPGLQPFGFAGGLYDRDTKLVHFGAREYAPAIGRWTAKDPSLFAGGDSNLYAYVLNDPVNLTDRDGRAGIGWWFGAQAEAGNGFGGSAQASFGETYFPCGGGYWASAGGFLGAGESGVKLAPSVEDWVFGISAGLGGGITLTDAHDIHDFAGPFDVLNVGVAWFSGQVAWGGGTHVFNIGVSKSWGGSVRHYKTYTWTSSPA
jgi:RHS repeat-associated protein